MIAIQNEREWQRFCELVLGNAALAGDPRYDNNRHRVEHRESVDRLIDGVFGNLDGNQVVARLRAADIAFGRLNDMVGLSVHPQLRRDAVDTASGEVRVVAFAARRSNFAETRRRVPGIGEHSDAIRAEFSAME